MKIKLLKYSYLLLFAIVIAYAVPVNANPPDEDAIKEIEETIRTMDAKKLADYFSSTIDLELDDLNGNYSKAQAEVIMRDFFKNNPSKSFTVNHQGDSKDGSKFFIGTYKASAKNYRVYGLLKKESGKLFLQQLQFDEE
jgi:hypothetical protein